MDALTDAAGSDPYRFFFEQNRLYHTVNDSGYGGSGGARNNFV